ncbi:hypothetical protein D9M69_558450 [compost metagenome]
MLFQEGLAVALHEGIVEGPEGQAEQGHPDQLLLQEELEVGRLAIEGLDQRRNVDPGLVVADHQVGPVLAQAFAAADIPVGRGEDGEDALAVFRPGLGDPHHAAGAGVAQARAGQDEFEQGDGQHGADQDQRVEQQQQGGGDSSQQCPHGVLAPRALDARHDTQSAPGRRAVLPRRRLYAGDRVDYAVTPMTPALQSHRAETNRRGRSRLDGRRAALAWRLASNHWPPGQSQNRTP